MTMYDIPHTVVETAPFLKRAADIWTDEERQDFVDFIASNRMAGDEIPGTGGLRKVRWSRAAWVNEVERALFSITTTNPRRFIC